jgi:N-acetylglucosaminyl-diphospho-decaprenol L-rhamnosyltransferase
MLMRLDTRMTMRYSTKGNQIKVAARVWIIIVNYRTPGLVIDCLHSLAPEVGQAGGIRVALVDNASGDGSEVKLREGIAKNGWSPWVELLPQRRNGGFAYGNNAGIAAALLQSPGPDYIMLLNPDTIVRPGAIIALAEFLDHRPEVGIVGGQLENADGSVEPSAHNAPSALGELESAARLALLSRWLLRHQVTPPRRTDAHQCDWVSGASMMVRRTLIDAIGTMDDRFFLYFEEVDFCSRARNAGWQVWFEPGSRVVHLEGASTGIGQTIRRRPAYWFDSRRRYFVKHRGVAGLLLADICWLLGRTSLAARRALRLGRGGTRQDPPWFTVDLLWGDLKALCTLKLRNIR